MDLEHGIEEKGSAVEECSASVGRKIKLRFACHVLRGSGGNSLQLVLEGKINGKRGPRLT